MKYVVILDGRLSFPFPMCAAKEMGLGVLYMSTDEKLSSAVSDLIDKVILVNKLDLEMVSNALDSLGLLDQVCYFLAQKDANGLLALSLNVRFCGFSETDFKPYSIAKNKYATRLALADSPYNPKFQLISPGDPSPFFCESGLIIKPLFGVASIGVERVQELSLFASAVARASSTLHMFKAHSLSKDVSTENLAESLLVEEYVGGEEISVDTFSYNGQVHILGVCGKSPMKAPFFEEVSYLSEPAYSDEQRTMIYTAATTVLKLLGLMNGPGHLEFKVLGDRIVLLEANLRVGGQGLTHLLYETSSGIKQYHAIFTAALGLDPARFLTKSKSDLAALYLCQVGDGGVVSELPMAVSITGAELVFSEVFIQKNEKLTPYPAFSGLPGYFLYLVQGRDSVSYGVARDLFNRYNAVMNPKFLNT